MESVYIICIRKLSCYIPTRVTLSVLQSVVDEYVFSVTLLFYTDDVKKEINGGRGKRI